MNAITLSLVMNEPESSCHDDKNNDAIKLSLWK